MEAAFFLEVVRPMCVRFGQKSLWEQATIHPVFPYIRVRVNANVLLFRPKAGQSMGELFPACVLKPLAMLDFSKMVSCTSLQYWQVVYLNFIRIEASKRYAF